MIHQLLKRFFNRKKKPVKSTIIIDNKDQFQSDILNSDLVDKDISDNDKQKVRQYTKKLITGLSVMACIWISYSYILATIALIQYRDTSTLEELSKQVCVTIIGIVISYCLKSYFESWSKGKHEIEQAQLLQSAPSLECEVNTDEEIYG